jgi:predicted DNA-binding ribbon-helix-helix protein
MTIRNIVIGSRRTSVRLESAFWAALQDIAQQQQRTVNRIVTEIAGRRREYSLASAIRVYVLEYYQAQGGLPEPQQSPHS